MILKGVTVEKIKGGLNLMPVVNSGIGIGRQFLNKDPIEPFIEAMEVFIKKEHGQDYRLANIYESHKPHSKYKYVAIIFKEKCKNTNPGPCFLAG